MSLQTILNEDWSEYDNRKKRGGSDHRNFACTETWEVDDLVTKIHKHHSTLSTSAIRDAIKACCNSIGSPHPREKFVKCVTDRLGIASA